jgi:tetratricopeptide (TPR) repeat protein
MFEWKAKTQRSLQHRESYARIYCDLADRYLAGGEMKMAVYHFDESLRFDPDHTEAHVGRAVCLLKTGRAEEALIDLNVALRLCPDCTEALRLRALINLDQARFDSAMMDVTRAIRLDPGCAAAFRIRGAAYFATGDFHKATADLTAAIHLAPNDVDLHCFRAMARLAAGDFKRVGADADRALMLDPTNQDASLMRDMARAAMNRHRTPELLKLGTLPDIDSASAHRAQVRPTARKPSRGTKIGAAFQEEAKGRGRPDRRHETTAEAQRRVGAPDQHRRRTDRAPTMSNQYER